MISKNNLIREGILIKVIDSLVTSNTLRKIALKMAKEKAYAILVEENADGRPRRVQEDKYHIILALLNSLDRLLTEKTIAPSVRKALLKNLAGRVFLEKKSNKEAFIEEHGFEPPLFVLVSPTKRCNLHCVGCYASSSSANAEKLDYAIFDRILTEKAELWGSYFTVISGGEPLLWKSEGKDLIDIVGQHNDQYFMMYTNGTLIDEKMAQRMAEVGNITPAISVEGFEKETDARRGKGTFKRILKAFENLRNAGVPFGISATPTRLNAELLVSDEFIDFYYNQQGAVYGWLFQYMPIGRSYTLDLLVTPEQRKWMFEREHHLVWDRGIFIADFWNSGTLSNGCIAGGRSGGYFYIDWNGNCLPCAFYPYYTHNIIEVYQNGGNLNTVLMCPFFQGIRKWQESYGYNKPAHEVDNEIVPCAIKDHYREARKNIEYHHAKPGDQEAAQALKDPEYYKGLVAYGEAVYEITRPIWEKEYVGPERERAQKLQQQVAA